MSGWAPKAKAIGNRPPVGGAKSVPDGENHAAKVPMGSPLSVLFGGIPCRKAVTSRRQCQISQYACQGSKIPAGHTEVGNQRPRRRPNAGVVFKSEAPRPRATIEHAVQKPAGKKTSDSSEAPPSHARRACGSRTRAATNVDKNGLFVSEAKM